MNLLLFERRGVDFFVTGERNHHSVEVSTSEQSRLERLKLQIRSAYEKIRHKFDYQENVCSSMRHADSVRLIHAESLSQPEVEERFRAFLDYRNGKHKKWMIIDGVLALFGSLLTPIPGPNVFFLYPAVRALSHYLALRGVQKAQRLKMFTFQAESVVDRIQLNLEHLDKVEGEIGELENRFDLRDLKNLLST